MRLKFDHRTDEHLPETWNEYITLMADTGTFPDVVFAHAAARLYSCQIALFCHGSDMVMLSPPKAFRRIVIFVTADWQHANWGARVASASLPDTATLTISATDLAERPQDALPRDDQLHTLFSHHTVNADRLHHLHCAHNGYTGHPGVEATVRHLTAAGITWHGMTADAAQFVRRCPTCCSSRLKLHHAPVSAASLRLHARPLKRWHIDQSGPGAECTFTGYRRFIAFICETTQCCVLFGSRHGTALEVAIALIAVMGLFGLPELLAVHSDHGKENDNYIWQQLIQITGIKHTFSIPYIASTNGIAERNIQTCKRFLRTLCVDNGRHDSWGLLLPIAQKGINDLPRDELQWHCPAEIVFASLYDHTDFVIPFFYSREMRENDLDDVHAYQVSANFPHRAMCFQQQVLDTFHEIKDSAFAAAVRSNPSESADLQLGQAVLIDWENDAPSPQHPSKRGPYRVVDIRRNTVVLQHISQPAPDGQDDIVTWSKHAHAYVYCDDAVPHRSDGDPSASMVAALAPSQQIECVLSHTPLSPADRAAAFRNHRNHVANQMYTCRLFAANIRQTDHPAVLRSFLYDDIKHTFAFDMYVVANRNLSGHSPIMHMPINWSPHAAIAPLRPPHRPSPVYERQVVHISASETSDLDA
jgi:hypothetical protein